MSDGAKAAAMCVVIALLGWHSWYLWGEIDKRDARRAIYIKEQQCFREGFAGRSAEPIYRCKTGLFLERELGDVTT